MLPPASARRRTESWLCFSRSTASPSGIRWQTHGYDAGYGGGTLAAWFAGQNMDAIDVGIGPLSMHSPFEVSSNVDLWHLHRGFTAFVDN